MDSLEEVEIKPKPIKLDLSDENLDKVKTRWTIKPHSSKYLVIKFYSTEVDTCENKLVFELLGYSKQFGLTCRGICAFPTINTDIRNIFMHRKRHRPHSIPECFLNKHYIQNEQRYDFGPLLIGKT